MLAAALALLPNAAGAASRVHKSAVKPATAAPARTSAQNNGNYYVPYVKDAAGNHVPIMQVPGSVVVVPRQVMDDQQDITVCGALRNVSAVFCR